MSKMVIQDKEMVEVEPIDNQYPYLVKRGKMEPFIDMMEQDGCTFVDRDIMANSLIFEKGDQSKSVPYKLLHLDLFILKIKGSLKFFIFERAFYF